MAEAQSFPIGQAPWEQQNSTASPNSFPIGQAPWETTPQTKSSWLDTSLPFNTTPRAIIKGGLNALPSVGMIGGALIGEGVGSVPLAAAGGAAGESLKQAGESLLGEGPESRQQQYQNLGMAGIDSAAAEAGGKVIGKALGAAADSGPGQYVLKKAGKAASTVASALSGIPRQEIEVYAKNAPEINQLAQSANYSNQEMADNLRSNINSDIQAARQNLNNQISNAFDARSGQTVDAQPIINKLNSAKSQINAKLRPQEIEQVDEMINQVNSVSRNGQIPLQDAHDLKELFQEQGSGAYSKNGQIFQNGSKAQQAAKSAAASTRQLVNQAAPEIAQANSTLSRLHDIEDVMNSSLLAEGKTSSSIYSAGSGANEANAKALDDLGQITGQDYLGQAKRIATARTFGNAAILPVDSTGKVAARMGAAGIAGYAAGGVPGALVLEGAASPLGLKGIINAGTAVKNIGQGILKETPSIIGQSAHSIVIPQGPTAPMDFPAAAGNQTKPQATPTPQPSMPTPQSPLTMPAQGNPQKGPDKWSMDGFQNLRSHVNDDDRKFLDDNKAMLMLDPKAKQLLITASSFEPGTKPLDQIIKHLKNRIGDNK